MGSFLGPKPDDYFLHTPPPGELWKQLEGKNASGLGSAPLGHKSRPHRAIFLFFLIRFQEPHHSLVIFVVSLFES